MSSSSSSNNREREAAGPSYEIAAGSRVKVYWTGEKRWFEGRVARNQIDCGKRVHQVVYKDGDVKWHCMHEEWWLYIQSRRRRCDGQSVADRMPPIRKRAAAPPSSRARVAHLSSAGRRAADRASESLAPLASPSASGSGDEDCRSSDTTGSADCVARQNQKPELTAGPLRELDPGCATAARQVTEFPCDVVKLSGFLSHAHRRQLHDCVICAGWEHRSVGLADMWYTEAKGAPDVLLHWNYYSKPTHLQPPPMQILEAAESLRGEWLKLRRHAPATSKAEAPGYGVRSTKPRAQPSARNGGKQRQRSAVGPVSSDFESDGDGGLTSKIDYFEQSDSSNSDDSGSSDGEMGEMPAGGFPKTGDFHSVLALGYQANDMFRWHTDLAGTHGWVCLLSIGQTVTFQYLPVRTAACGSRAETSAWQWVPPQAPFNPRGEGWGAGRTEGRLLVR